MSDAGLVHLKGFAQLQELYLRGIKMSDAGLVHLKGFTRLQGLEIGDTDVSDPGVKKLQQALPNCQIMWFPR